MTRARLEAAIRRITVDAVDKDGEPAPNGVTEQAIDDMGTLLDPEMWDGLTGADIAERVAACNGVMSRLCGAMVADVMELRLAAEAHFGGDFTKPRAS